MVIERANTMRGSRNFCCPISPPGGENYGDGGKIMTIRYKHCWNCECELTPENVSPGLNYCKRCADYFFAHFGMKKWNGERECKYCKNPSEYLAICQNYETETRIFVGISGEYLQIFDEDYPGFCDNHKINFCPMCGRKLG